MYVELSYVSRLFEELRLYETASRTLRRLTIHSFIRPFLAPLQVLYYSEALPTTARILYRSFTPKRTGNCRQWTCPRSLRAGPDQGVHGPLGTPSGPGPLF